MGIEPPAAGNRMTIYKKMLFQPHGNTVFGDIRLKAYTITADGRYKSDLLPALQQARAILDKSLIPGISHRGLGYFVHHAGEDADWVLTRVRLRGDIAAGLLAANHGNGYEEVSEPSVECVWEAVVGQQERTMPRYST